jgi:hypothetical protein
MADEGFARPSAMENWERARAEERARRKVHGWGGRAERGATQIEGLEAWVPAEEAASGRELHKLGSDARNREKGREGEKSRERRHSENIREGTGGYEREGELAYRNKEKPAIEISTEERRMKIRTTAGIFSYKIFFSFLSFRKQKYEYKYKS